MRVARLVLLVLLPTLDACALLSAPAPVREEAAGPVVVLAEGMNDGRAWRYIAYRTEDGVCEEIEFGDAGGNSSGCITGGLELQPGMVNLGVTAGSGQPTFVVGQAGVEVATVRISTRFDGDIEVRTFDAPRELGVASLFFIAVLPEQSTVMTAVTRDSSGAVLERIDMGLSP
jgi:hypothetical protein